MKNLTATKAQNTTTMVSDTLENGSSATESAFQQSPLEQQVQEEASGFDEAQELEKYAELEVTPATVDWRLLPPFLEPKENKRREFNRGATLIVFLTLVALIMTHGVGLNWLGGIEQHWTVWWVFLALIYALASLEIALLIGMYFRNPGVVERSEETCFPIPLEVQPHVLSYLQQQQQKKEGNPNHAPELMDIPVPLPIEHYIGSEEDNSQNGGTGDTYCVRCLVWRRGKKKYYHCNTCQRCVMYYDHHCGVYGRCIAGKLPHYGNIPMFYLSMIVGVFGYIIAALTILWNFGAKISRKA